VSFNFLTPFPSSHFFSLVETRRDVLSHLNAPLAQLVPSTCTPFFGSLCAKHIAFPALFFLWFPLPSLVVVAGGVFLAFVPPHRPKMDFPGVFLSVFPVFFQQYFLLADTFGRLRDAVLYFSSYPPSGRGLGSVLRRGGLVPFFF